MTSVPRRCLHGSRSLVLAFFLALVFFVPAGARSRHRARSVPHGAPGDFAYYVLSLSWSPQYCAETRKQDPQCNGERRFGFVAHGLWPQYEKGWPESCGGRPVESAVVQSMLDIMPSPSLVRHEWEKHGTCSGLAPSDYFEKVRQAFSSVHVPPAFQGSSPKVETTPEAFRAALIAANPKLGKDGVAIQCSGRYLQEVRVCLDRDLAPRACAKDVRDLCPSPEMIVRPIR